MAIPQNTPERVTNPPGSRQRHNKPVLHVVGATCLLCLLAIIYALLFKGVDVQSEHSAGTTDSFGRPPATSNANFSPSTMSGETAYTNTPLMNVRSEPGSESSIVGKLSRGETVTCFDRVQAGDAWWVKVRAGSLEGWVNEKLISRERPTPALENLPPVDITLKPGGGHQGFAFQKNGNIALSGITFGRCKVDPKYPENSEVYISGPSKTNGYYFVLCWVDQEGGVSAQIIKGATGGVVATDFIPKDWGVGKWVIWSPEDRYALMYAVGEVTMGDMVYIDLRDGKSGPLEFKHITAPVRNSFQPEIQHIDDDSLRWLDPHRFTIRLYVTCNPYEIMDCDHQRVVRQNNVTVDLDTRIQQYN